MVFLKRYPNPYAVVPYSPYYNYGGYVYPTPAKGPFYPGTKFGSCDCDVGYGSGIPNNNNCTNGAIPVCVPGRNCICYNPYLRQAGCFNETNRTCTYR